jgi:hypothetical protein
MATAIVISISVNPRSSFRTREQVPRERAPGSAGYAPYQRSDRQIFGSGCVGAVQA